MLAVALGCGLLAPGGATASAAATDPDWPCMQPPGPALTPDMYRDGSAGPEAPPWRADARIAGIVAAIVPREAPLAEARDALTAFIDSLPAADRATGAAELLDGLVETTNLARDRVMARIRDMGRRERALGETIAALEAGRNAAPAPQDGDAAQRRTLALRSFQSLRQTLRYACEVPVTLESRLAQFARVLRQRAGD